MNGEENLQSEQTPSWRPLTREQRRVVGVLIEKAKTTPDAYPMTLNSISTGCNQKSNRSPQMTLPADDVQVVLDELRELGAVVEVQTSGRVPKFKHLMYEWLGVDKTELAIMAELLLRGEQTLGELRARASRMERIADLSELRPLLTALIERGLVVELTPPGRGQLVTHALYDEREMEQLRNRAALHVDADDSGPTPAAAPRDPSSAARKSPVQDELVEEVARLRQQLSNLESRVEKIEQLMG